MTRRMSIGCAATLVALAALLAPRATGAQTCSYTPLTFPCCGGTTTTTTPQNFSIAQTNACWALVAVRSSGSDDWDSYLYQSPASPPACVSGLLADSRRTSGVDFVIGDFNHNPLGTYYVQASRWSGSSAALVEWSQATGVTIPSNGPGMACTSSLGASRIAEMTTLELTAGTTYTFTFQSLAGSVKFLLFRNPGGGTYWASRADAEFEVSTSTTYTAPATGAYCAVFVVDIPDPYYSSYRFGYGICGEAWSLDSGVGRPNTPPGSMFEYLYKFDQQVRYWTAVGVRGGSADWDIDVWGSGSGGAYPQCFSNLLANSLGVPPRTDLIVGDFNFNATGTYYVRAYPAECTSQDDTTEWDGGAHQLVLNADCQGRSLGPTDVLAIWDVYLTAGTSYAFSLQAHGASGYLSAPRLLLFRNPGAGTYWAGRSTAEFDVQAQATVNYTAPSSGFYGVVAVNETGDTGYFDPVVRTCLEPLALSPNTPVTLAAGQTDLSFTSTVPFWTAVGVRCDSPSWPWYLDVYGSRGASPSACLTGYKAGSHADPPRMNLVVGNNVTGTQYVNVYDLCFAPHTGNAHVVWDPSEGVLQVNGPLTVWPTGPDDFLRVWDVNLVAGTTYHISFNPTGASPRLLVYRNVPGGTYWASRTQAELELTASADYTPPSSGYYGLVVVNDDGAVGQYGLGVGTCTTPSALASGVVTTTFNAENYHSINQGVPYWTAVGVRGASDWDLEVYSAPNGSGYPVCLAGQRANSALDPPTVDFVVGDFNRNPFGSYYVRPHLFLDLGSGAGAVEWDGGTDQLNPGMPAVVRTTGAGDVLECWDALLEPSHRYQFVFTYGGSASLSLGVFRNTVGGTYWAGRADAQILVNQTTSWITPAGQPQFYGLVVVNENGMNGSYSLQVVDQGAVGVEAPAAPQVTELRGVRPNPARGPLQIHFALREAGRVRFDVMDMAGRRIATVAERDEVAGTWTLPWEGSTGDGLRPPPGLYILRMVVNGRSVGQTRVILLE